MFADTRGVLVIRGSASGADFAFYRLEYGQGLNPLAWVQLGQDVKSPVQEGELAKWDTNGLNGLYALRLLVVHGNQRVEQAVVQVTVDNTPPQVALTYPQDGQAIQAASEPQVTLQAQINDPFLAKVEFDIDDSKVGEFTAAPFGLVWPATMGGHTFRVVASDRAGNRTEATVKFTVTK